MDVGAAIDCAAALSVLGNGLVDVGRVQVLLLRLGGACLEAVSRVDVSATHSVGVLWAVVVIVGNAVRELILFGVH